MSKAPSKMYAPALTGVVEAVLVVVLLFFLLYDRRDLRDRFVRLAARARIVISANTIESAGHTVGLYLLLISLNNFCFGVILALVLWMLGLPNPEFWGLLAFLLRYIPYIGATISSLLPAIVAFAVFPGWMKSFEVIGFYVILDQITVHLIEPFMIGSGIDMSPVALLVCVMYWSWLWGVAGLLLAIPLTACIKVAAEHIEQLNFISLLLGGERALERYHEFYRLLLEMDSAGAQGMVIRYCNEKGIEAAFDQIITPAVRLAGRERSRDHISPEQFQYMIGFVRDLIPDLGSRFGRGRAQTDIRVLGICPPGEVHTLALLTVLQLFRCAGAAVRFAGEGISIQDISEVVRSFMPAAVCISVSMNDAMPAAIELTAMLRQAYPGLLILAGGDALSSRAEDLMRAGCTRICAGRSDLNRSIRVIAGGRKLRTHSIYPTSHAERT
jgi:methanogenic corrinoid protein MtbC1